MLEAERARAARAAAQARRSPTTRRRAAGQAQAGADPAARRRASRRRCPRSSRSTSSSQARLRQLLLQPARPAIASGRRWSPAATSATLSGAWTLDGRDRPAASVPVRALRRRQPSIKLPGGELEIELRRRPGRAARPARQRRPAGGAGPVAAAAGRRAGEVRRGRTISARRRCRPRGPVRRAGGHLRRVECRFYVRSRRRPAGGHGNVPRGRRRSLRAVLRRLSRGRRPHAARADRGPPRRRRRTRSSTCTSRFRRLREESTDRRNPAMQCEPDNDRRQRVVRRWRLLLLAVASAWSRTPARVRPSRSPSAIEADQPKIVKIYGAGGLQRAGSLSERLPDFGRRARADRVELRARHRLHHGHARRRPQVRGQAGRRRSAAGSGRARRSRPTTCPTSTWPPAVPADAGTRVLAFSNLFGVATGDEPASVQHGVIAVKTRLDARRGVFETPYHGPVYVLDAMTNNPGAAGGALIESARRAAGHARQGAAQRAEQHLAQLRHSDR